MHMDPTASPACTEAYNADAEECAHASGSESTESSRADVRPHGGTAVPAQPTNLPANGGRHLKARSPKNLGGEVMLEALYKGHASDRGQRLTGGGCRAQRASRFRAR